MTTGSIVFIIILLGSITFFALKVRNIIGNIRLGKKMNRTDNSGERMKTTMLVALGQSKMVTRPIAGLLHIFIYVAFVITQIELLETIIDGISGQHRVFAGMGGFYLFVISLIEVLSVLALIATLAFLARRNLLKIPRFVKSEMTGWPKLDGNIILYLEFILVIFIFMMNGAEEAMIKNTTGQNAGFLLTQHVGPAIFGGMKNSTLLLIAKIGWWGHFGVVMAFLCYLPFSKHLHIHTILQDVHQMHLHL